MAGPKLQERFLQWYVIKNPHRLPLINGKHVVQVIDNLDRFPDLTLILDDSSAVHARSSGNPAISSRMDIQSISSVTDGASSSSSLTIEIWDSALGRSRSTQTISRNGLSSRDFHFAARIGTLIHDILVRTPDFFVATFIQLPIPVSSGRARRGTDWSPDSRAFFRHLCALAPFLRQMFSVSGHPLSVRHRQRPDPPQHVAEQPPGQMPFRQ